MLFVQCLNRIKDGTFLKLMEALIESVILYGSEVWGCTQNLEPIELVQLRAYRIYLGVGKCHPRSSLHFEMGILPVNWLAKL